MTRTVTLLFAGMLLMTGIRMAGADVIIYDAGGPNQNSFYFGDTTYPYTAAADSFTLQDGASTVTDAHWWGACVTSDGTNTCPAGDFTLGFYTDDAGVPGSLIQSYSVGNANQTATGNFIGVGADFTEYSYAAVFAPLVLTPGENYWFAVSNTTDWPTVAWGMEGTGSPFGGGHYQYSADEAAWTAVNEDLAFNLTAGSTIPEPTTLSLFGLSAIVAVLRHRYGKPRV